MVDEIGAPAVDIRSMGKVLQSFWKPLGQKHGSTEDWTMAAEAMKKQLPVGFSKTEVITAEHIKAALGKMRAGAVLGCDAWAVAEL